MSDEKLSNLLVLKREIENKYLGQSGICCVGIRTFSKSVCLYVNCGLKIMESQTLKEIKLLAGNINILVKEINPSHF